MLTILEQSDKGKAFKGFRTIFFGSSNNCSNKLTKTFWSLQTNVRKTTLLRYLEMKAIFNQASKLEYRMLLDWPGVLEDELFVSALRAKLEGIDMETLFQRVAWLQKLEGEKEFSINLFHTLDGVVNFRFMECRVPIRKGKKFSGYVRNSSAVGSKNSKQTFIPEPESFEWTFDVKIDYFQFLSVGRFDSGTPGTVSVTPMMNPIDSKRSIKTKGKN